MNLQGILTEAELGAVTARSDWRAAWLVICQWALVIAIFALLIRWPNPLAILLAVALFGGRQLGFGVLVHECGHRTLFRTQKLNDLVGDWLLAPPTFNNMHAYMRGHLHHHRLAGTREDPDLPNYQDYPISRERLQRKLTRDITGQTGWRTLRGIGRGIANLPRLPAENRAVLLRGLGCNGLMLLGCTLAGAPWAWLVWVAGYVFANPLISRIRQVAEHAAVPDLYDPDPRRNTRTVLPGPLARLIMCPHQINYHLEHHMLAAVPIYRLPRLHRLLRAKGFYAGVEFPTSYRQLLRKVTRVDAAAPTAA